MATQSPPPLEMLCLELVCANIEDLCQEVLQGDDFAFRRLAFKWPVFLYEHLAESILTRLASTGKLSSRILTLFLDRGTCRLRKICIANSDVLEMLPVLKVLLEHHLVSDLDLRGSKIQFSELCGSITSHLIFSLQRLNLSNVRKQKLNSSVLCQLKSLRHLDISRRGVNDKDLYNISECLPQIESLNISCTDVTDVNSLGNLKNSLKVLQVYNSPVAWKDRMRFAEFTSLLQLDISINPDKMRYYDLLGDAENVEALLETSGVLPNLIDLDISGTPGVMYSALQVFQDSHPQLRFLGLCKTGLTSHVDFLSKDMTVG